ncbi:MULTISPECIES: AfsR/SARP family transcriptional regulator [unclassified Streptomyces]|uniref:AfsR/SARP family transcriptional regulator n=1 Tax=unclassified Streptomyces TaxID=2593676 RepID=UPI00378F91EC
MMNWAAAGACVADGDAGQLQFDLLGPLSVRRGGRHLDLGPVRRQAVLVALVLRAGHRVTHEDLIDDIWGDHPPPTGVRVLPSHVYALRQALETEAVQGTGVIRSGKGWYSFDAQEIGLDTDELAARSGRAHEARACAGPAAALALFGEALALFRGEPLAGLPGRYTNSVRRQLQEQWATLRRGRLECLFLLGRSAEALEELAELTASRPLDEGLLALQVRALYTSGRQAEALDAFHLLRERLREEHGAEPGEELRGLYEAVLRQDDTILLPPPGTYAPAPVSFSPPVNELPGDVGPLVGREAELALLSGPGSPGGITVVAVDGTPGIGKTRLSVQAARQLAHLHPAGCLFVDLRAHATGQPLSPRRALARMLRTLGRDSDRIGDDEDELVAAWRTATSGLRLLLVLDDAVDAQQVRPLLPSGPDSTVIVTSRRRLAGLDATRRHSLAPLPEEGGVRLLSSVVGPDRTNREPQAAAELARLCDGLPLALRIIGARLQTRPEWTLAHMVDRMAGDEDRLKELNADDRSVAAAFQLSYEHLPPQQQHIFRVLGLSPTVEFDARTPAAMLTLPAHETGPALENLVDAGLVRQPRPGRYRLHDLVRAHARRLAQATPSTARTAGTAALRLHLDAARMASDWGPEGFPAAHPLGPSAFTDWRDAADWLDETRGEIVDVVSHALSLGEKDLACSIAEALTEYLISRGRHHDARAVLGVAIESAPRTGDRRMIAALRNCMGMTELFASCTDPARTWFEEAADLSRRYGEPAELARAMTGLGAVALQSGDTAAAEAHIETALQVIPPSDDWGASAAHSALGYTRLAQERAEEALDCFGVALARARMVGRPRVQSRTLICMADAHSALGQPHQALPLLHEAAALATAAKDLMLLFLALARLGTAVHQEGHPDAAMPYFGRALTVQRKMKRENEPQWGRVEMDIRCRVGRAHLTAGRRDEARQQFQAALTLPEASAYDLERAQAIHGLQACAAHNATAAVSADPPQ